MNEASAKPAIPDPSLPLFRPEAMGEPEYGEAFAFVVAPWRALALLAVAALLLVLVFGFFANFDRVAPVRGLIVPVAGVSRLAAPQPGIVSEVYVRQGQRIAKGTPILKIASPDRLPSGAAARAETLRTFRQQQEVTAETIAAERQRRAAERLRLNEHAEELAAKAQSYRHQIALQQERIARNEERLTKLGPLRDKGYVSDVTYLVVQDALLTQRQQLAVLRQNETEANHELQHTRLQVAELAAEGRRTELQAQASLLELERGAAGAQVEAEVTLAASIDGIVSTLRATPGMTVQLQDELAAIIPAGTNIEGILFVPTSAAGSLRRGQQVALRYDAFSYQRHGVGHGVVTDIASSATAEQPDGPATYRVKVRLTDADRFPLRADMTLTGIVTLERRSLLDWLFAPLREKWRENRRGGSS